jgi:Flp pilus assembly protein TadB
VIEVLVLAHERGGQIVRDILEDLVAATTRDLKLLEEVETEGLEMKINARAVLVLPWLVLLALTVREGPFRDFYRSAGGLLVVLVAGALSAVGGFLIARLARTRAEQRVFGSSATPAIRARG